MAELPRVGAVGPERMPVRALGPAEPARFRHSDGPELVPERVAPAGEREAAPNRGGWFRRAWSSQSLSSASFAAQSAAQLDPGADLPLKARLANEAYRGAAALNVEILGLDPPLDLRV